MERADPQATRIAAQELGDTRAHLAGSLVREGDREDALRRDAVLRDEVGDPRRQDSGLARPRPGEHEERSLRVLDGLALRGI